MGRLVARAWQGSLRTGSVFRSIAGYLAESETCQVFQFENVMSLAAKPKPKPTKDSDGKKGGPSGPSNLSACCYILDKQAGMWSHCWALDSREHFGSGQQRQRLYGSCFKKKDLAMTLDAAHKVLNETMNFLAGVSPCDPEEYLLAESSDVIKAERSVQALRALDEAEFLVSTTGGKSLCISALFRTNGTLPGALRHTGHKRKLKAVPSDSSPGQAKWKRDHAYAFRALGEETLCVCAHSFLSWHVIEAICRFD